MGYQHEKHFNKHHAVLSHNNFSIELKRIPYLSIMQKLSWNLNQLLLNNNIELENHLNLTPNPQVIHKS